MTSVALCPNCGGQKTVSKPSYIAGNIDTWGGDTSLYPCPTCDGRGWIRVDSVAQDEFDCIKSVALSSMETAEALMDECVKRADKIKELETELGSMVAAEHAADEEIGRLQMTASDTKRRKVLVTAELERRACVAEDELCSVKEMRDELLEDWESKRYAIAQLESKNKELCDELDHSISENDMISLNKITWALNSTIDDLLLERERDKPDVELLDEILRIVNPLIKSGGYAKPAAESRLLAIRMHELCQTVVQFRRKHNIVG